MKPGPEQYHPSNSERTVSVPRIHYRLHSCRLGFARFLPGNVVRAGIGLWGNISSVKALQIALNIGVVPHESAGVDNRTRGYGIVFHDTLNDTYSLRMPDGSHRPHPYTGVSCGIFLGPDGPHEMNHNGPCRENYGGPTCYVEIAGLNLNPHEQNHARKGVHLRSFNTMTFPHFVYSLRGLNKLHNEKYNHKH